MDQQELNSSRRATPCVRLDGGPPIGHDTYFAFFRSRLFGARAYKTAFATEVAGDWNNAISAKS
jgi:hypothetical protein